MANLLDRFKTKPYFKLFLFVTIVFLLDFSIGKALSHYYFTQESGLQYRTTYSIEKTPAEILIFGSSRANHHYQPDIFEKEMKMSYYNVGRDGSFIFYHYAILKGVLKRYKPKIIVLDLMPQEFKKNQESYDRLSNLLPYYKSHSEIRSIVELKSPFEKLKLASQIYPYNSSIFTIAVGNTEGNKKRKPDNKGYIALTNEWKQPLSPVSYKVDYELDTLKIRYYSAFIKECINANIKLYVVCSPYFGSSDRSDHSVEISQKIAKDNNIAFYDFSKDSLFLNNATLFADINHLNDNGAKKFTDIMIKQVMKHNPDNKSANEFVN